MPAGRPRKEFDKKLFTDLIGLGCTEEEICWVFRGDDGCPIDVNTLSNWCKRTYGVNFSEYAKKNRLLALKIKLRKYQIDLAKKSAAMAIWLGKQYLGQKETVDNTEINISEETRKAIAGLLDGINTGTGDKDTETDSL